MNAANQPEIDVLLKITEACRQVGYGKSSVYAMIKAGTFPEPIKLGYGSRWSQQEVQAWIEKQKDARKAA